MRVKKLPPKDRVRTISFTVTREQEKWLKSKTNRSEWLRGLLEDIVPKKQPRKPKEVTEL